MFDIRSNGFLAGFLLDVFPCIENEVCSILEACSDPLYVGIEVATVLWGPLK